MSDPGVLTSSSDDPCPPAAQTQSSSSTPVLAQARPKLSVPDSTRRKLRDTDGYSDECIVLKDSTKRNHISVRRSDLAKHGYRFRNNTQQGRSPMLIGTGCYCSTYYVHSVHGEAPGYKAMKMCFVRATRFSCETLEDYEFNREHKLKEVHLESRIARAAGEKGIGPVVHSGFVLDGTETLDTGAVVKYEAYCVVMDYAGISLYSCIKTLDKNPLSDSAISIRYFLQSPHASRELILLLQKMWHSGFLHNDLHCGNVMLKLDNDGCYKWLVIDFGCAEYGARIRGEVGAANFAYTTTQASSVHCQHRDLLTLVRSIKSSMYGFESVAVNYAMSPLFCALAEIYIDEFCAKWSGFGEHYDRETEALQNGMLTRVEFFSNVITLSVEYLFDNAFIRPFSISECTVEERHYTSRFDVDRLAKHFKQPEHRCEWVPWRPKIVNVQRFLAEKEADGNNIGPIAAPATKRQKLN